MVKGALECTRHFPRYERKLGIPTHLLSAIALTESGRFHKGLNIQLPWPWTISSGGKGQYFKSKEEAVAAVKKLQAKGVTNIDIGCMQVNMRHHGDAFSSVEQAFEPQNNIAYAAKFLRNLYDENRTWKDAASDYHSRTPSLGKKYVGRVYNSWYKIIEKLREARVNVPASSVQAMHSMKYDTPKTTRLASIQPSAKIEPILKTEKNVQVYRAPHMREISVRSNTTRELATPDALAVPTKSADIRPVDKSSIIVLNHATNQGAQPVAAVSADIPSEPAALPPATAVPTNELPATQQGASSGVSAEPVVMASVSYPGSHNNGLNVPPAMAPPVPVVAAGSAMPQTQASLSISAPLDQVATAALLPVSGVIDAAVNKAATSFQTPPSQPTPTQLSQVEATRIDYAARRVMEESYPHRSGPRFIFSKE